MKRIISERYPKPNFLPVNRPSFVPIQYTYFSYPVTTKMFLYLPTNTLLLDVKLPVVSESSSIIEEVPLLEADPSQELSLNNYETTFPFYPEETQSFSVVLNTAVQLDAQESVYDDFILVSKTELENEYEIINLGELCLDESFVVCPDIKELQAIKRSESFENMFHMKVDRKNIFYDSFQKGFLGVYSHTNYTFNRMVLTQTLEERLKSLRGMSKVKEILQHIHTSLDNPDHPVSYLVGLFDLGISNRLAAGIVSGFINAFVDSFSRGLPKETMHHKNVGWAFFQLRKDLDQLDQFVELIEKHYKELKSKKYTFFTKTSGSSENLLNQLKRKVVLSQEDQLERYKNILDYFLNKKNVGKDLFNSILLALADMKFESETKNDLECENTP